MDDYSAMSVTAACLLLLVTTAATNPVETNCQVEECANFWTIRFYQRLGCQPTAGSDSCCPASFDCSQFLSLDKTKCHYKGIVYDVGAEIREEIGNVCLPSCYCDSDSSEAQFRCTLGECPEMFDSRPLEPGCFRTHEASRCCSTGIRCVNDTDSGRATTECTYNGKTYLEGQYIETPDMACKTCYCQQGFDGTLDGPWCRTFNCDFTLKSSLSFLTTCAPIFYKQWKCCPLSWLCPSDDDIFLGGSNSTTHDEASDDDIFLGGSNSTTHNEGSYCSFGGRRFNVGDELITEDRVVKCRCVIPPYITCDRIRDSYP